MSSYHPDTVVISNNIKIDKIENLPEPCFITLDIPNIISDTLPNIFIQIEPNIIINNEQYLLNNYEKYHTIYTFNEVILTKCKNSKKYLYGTTTFHKEIYDNIDISKKKFKISCLSGSKLINNAIGHKNRQKLYEAQLLFNRYPITFFRSSAQLPHLPDYGNNPFLSGKNKIELFETYQFSIIIENSKQKNYFTEKLIDCLITKTIPIYWGCPNISDFFDISGWIILESSNDCTKELLNKLKLIIRPYYYNDYLTIVEKNYFKAIQYSDLYKNISEAT